MSNPQELHISFRHLDTDYDINLVRDEKAEHSVEINGVSYAILGEKNKVNAAYEILNSVIPVSSAEDLRGRLSLLQDISFPLPQKTDDIGTETLKTASVAPEEKTELKGIARVNQYIDALKHSDFYSGIALVAVGDKVIRQEIIMPQGLEQKRFTSETPFNILSVGKLFTAIAIMQLIEENVLKLDQSINQLLKLEDYTLKGCDEIYEGGKLEKSDLESFMKDRDITIHNLLTHTAGLIESPSSLTRHDKDKVGKESIYSNLGFQLLARIVANTNKEKLPFVDYVKNYIMKASEIEEEGSIKYIEHPPEKTEQPSHFSNSRPSGKAREVEESHRIPSPDGNGCFWMTASDLLKFADAFAKNKLLKANGDGKEILLKKEDGFAGRALGFNVDGDGSEKNPRRMMHPGGWEGASSGLCIIEGKEPITLICLSNFSEGNWALPGMWNAVLKEEFEKPFQQSEDLRNHYFTLKSLNVDDSEKIKNIISQIKPSLISKILIELEEEHNLDLISAIVKSLGISNIAEVALGLSEAGNQITLEKVRQAQQALINESYEILAKDLADYKNKNLKDGALLVQVVGLKEEAKPIVFGKRSVNDVVPIPLDENTIGRTGSGAKLWAGLLTNILTTKYGQYIQMNDSLGKFAPQEALKKFGRIGPDDKEIVDAKLANEMTIEGLIGMMAGLEYEQPKPKEPPESTLDQFLRGNEIKDGSIHILYHPKDKINFYTNNICFAAYPLEKAYKKVLAAELIEQKKLDKKQTLSELSPQLEIFRKQLNENIRKTEEDIESMKQLNALYNLDETLAFYENQLAYLKADQQKLSIPESVLDLTLKDLMACEEAYTKPPNPVYLYDLIDLFLMPSNNHQIDYAEIMKRELLIPLEMDHSGFYGVSGTQMDVTFENDKTKKDESYTPSKDHPMRYGGGFGRTTLSDASKLAKGLADPRGLVAKDNKTVLLTREQLNDFFKPHGHYKGWGLGGSELTCGGKVIDKGGSLNQDQYSFWVDRESGIGMIAMCNCGRRPDEILNAFKEKIEHINYPQINPIIKEKEGAPLGIKIDHYFAHPFKREEAQKLFEGSRGRVALLFDYDKAKKGIIHWSGTPLEVEKREDGAFHVTTRGRFKDIAIKKITGKVSGQDYLAVGDTSFIEINTDKLPSQANIEYAQNEFSKFRGLYINKDHLEWGSLQFDIQEDKNGNILLVAGEAGKDNLVPQSIIKVEFNAILFNGHDRQPPDKIFRFVRNSESAPWRLQVLDYASRQFIEERPKS